MGPRRTLQLSLIVAAVAAIVLAMTGALTPAAAFPADAPAITFIP